MDEIPPDNESLQVLTNSPNEDEVYDDSGSNPERCSSSSSLSSSQALTDQVQISSILDVCNLWL